MSLFTELKRRNVFKVGAAYLVVAWLTVQAASIAFPTFEAPAWALRVFIFVAMLGFPIALVIAWGFELTPAGIRVETAPAGNKRMLAIAGVLVALAIAWYFRAELPGVEQAPGQQRLAVLPFANFSPDPDNAFFTDGLHDDILTALSRLQGVEVISRTTMQTFRGSKLTLAEIAKRIGATHVLEGSVRRANDRVRLTVQLIDAQNDGHVWAETYDRTMGDALTLQSAVAKQVARVLEVPLAGGVENAPPTTVPAAYDLFLKARLTLERNNRLKLLDSALLLDPGFSLARALRAVTACQMLWFDDRQRRSLAPQARADIDQVRREAPGLSEADVAEAYYIYYVDLDFPRALATADRVLATEPNHPEALGVRATLLRRLDRFDEAIAAKRRSVELDPGNPAQQTAFSEILRSYGLNREAIAALDAAIATLPEGDAAKAELERQRIWAVFLLTGDRAGARAAMDALKGLVPEPVWKRSAAQFEDSASMRLEALALQPEWLPVADRIVRPRAVLVALWADFEGDAALRDAALEEAGRLYATLPAGEPMRPGSIAWHALFLSLRGDHAEAVEEARRSAAQVSEDEDAVALANVAGPAILALARAGAKGEALDLLERRARMTLVLDASNYHDPLLRKLLGDEPRYQAVMQRIAAKFEKL